MDNISLPTDSAQRRLERLRPVGQAVHEVPGAGLNDWPPVDFTNALKRRMSYVDRPSAAERRDYELILPSAQLQGERVRLQVDSGAV